MSDSVCPVALFDAFVAASTFKGILQSFYQICIVYQLDPSKQHDFYQELKQKLNCWKAQKLWALLDKRAAQKEYKKQRACHGLKTLVIGAGPCGLRMAIEMALLGVADVVVVECRERFSRNNVLHIWPFVIHDLKNLGAKVFHPKFCAGAIDHISIRQLQCILLKVALVLGVEVQEGVAFEEIVQPSPQQGKGWRANFSPSDHYLCDYEFDAVIGADGKRNTLPGFPRRELRGKLAIGITANFVNRRTKQEESVSEISGVAFIFNQQFFKDMRDATGIDLENIVYYKDETHYFVMCAKKQSLLDKRVLIQDMDDVCALLSPSNIDQSALSEYAREAADFATERRLSSHLQEYAVNHFGHPDVAMFDFTSLFSAEHSSRLVERHGHRLLMGIVGDSLHEPFWPTGSGCARGFLGCLDTAWMLRGYALGKLNPLQLLSEREAIFRLLAQTTPENLHKSTQKYTIDPSTRYQSLKVTIILDQVRHLVDTDQPRSFGWLEPLGTSPFNSTRSAHSELDSVSPRSLIRFYQSLLLGVLHGGGRISNLTSSWTDGRAFCAIGSRLIGVDLTQTVDGCDATRTELRRLAFDAILEAIGVATPDGADPTWLSGEREDAQLNSNYLAAIKSRIEHEIRDRLAERKAPIEAISTESEGDEEIEQLPIKSVAKPRTVVTLYAEEKAGKEENIIDRGEINVDQLTEQEALQLLEELDLEDNKNVNTSAQPFNSYGTRPPPIKYNRHRPTLIEKLAPQRLQAIEAFVSGEIQKQQTELLYKEKQKEANIKTRKLTQKEIDEMQTKLQETAIGSLLYNAQKREQVRVMSSLDEKVIREKTAAVRQIAVGGFQPSSSEIQRFGEFDQQLSDLRNKLTRPVIGGMTAVAELKQRHTAAVIGNRKKKPPVPTPPQQKQQASTRPVVTLPGNGNQRVCKICSSSVYLAERMCVEGTYLHKRCFRCAYCGAALRLGAYGRDRGLDVGVVGENRFFCNTHMQLPRATKLAKLGRLPTTRQKACSTTEIPQSTLRSDPNNPQKTLRQRESMVQRSHSDAEQRPIKHAQAKTHMMSPTSLLENTYEKIAAASRTNKHTSTTPDRTAFEVMRKKYPSTAAVPETVAQNGSKIGEGDREELDEDLVQSYNLGHDKYAVSDENNEPNSEAEPDIGRRPTDSEDSSSEENDLSEEELEELERTIDEQGGKPFENDAAAAELVRVWKSRRSHDALAAVADNSATSEDHHPSMEELTPIDGVITDDNSKEDPTFIDSSPIGETAMLTPSLRERKMEEWGRVRKAARERARLKSDEELGLPSTTNNHQQTPPSNMSPKPAEVLPSGGQQGGIFSRLFSPSNKSPKRIAAATVTSTDNDAVVSSESTKETGLLSKFGAMKYKSKRKSKSPNRPAVRLTTTPQRTTETTDVDAVPCSSLAETSSHESLLDENPDVAKYLYLPDNMKASISETNMQSPTSSSSPSVEVSSREIRRVQKTALRVVRERERKRVFEQQTLSRRLQELHVRRAQLRTDGHALEARLANDSTNRPLLLQWLCLCAEDELVEAMSVEVSLRCDELQLERRHTELQTQFRDGITDAQPVTKSIAASGFQREQQLLQAMLEVVGKRDTLGKEIERQRELIERLETDLDAERSEKEMVKMIEANDGNFANFRPFFSPLSYYR